MLQVKNAEKYGAVGVIIYSDPADDGNLIGTHVLFVLCCVVLTAISTICCCRADVSEWRVAFRRCGASAVSFHCCVCIDLFIVYIWFVFVVYCQRGSLFMYGDPLTPDFAAVGLGMFLSPLILFLWRFVFQH